MIYVKGRNDGKGLELGLGFDSGEEMEVKEGEACSYQDFGNGDDDDDDFDPTVDPDVALSYIDEKLQDVLGHFQKDFEGVVTAENLGAKFGDYGSFLPTYQRTPAWSHLRRPAKAVNHNLTTSLSKCHPEDGVHVVRRHEDASIGNLAKRTEAILSSYCGGVSSSRFELEKNYGLSFDQNLVKTSVEVGSDKLSTRKMAEVNSGLDFELSPSSLRESPADNESPNESPSRILQIMTSFSVHENLLLSPLTEYLINLTVKKKRLCKEGKSSVSKKVSRTRTNVSDPLKRDDNNFRSISSMQQKNLNIDNTRKADEVVLKKEIDSDTLACEKLVNAFSEDTANGEFFYSNVQGEEASEFKDVNAVLSSETQPIVSKGRKTENVEFFDQHATLQQENDLQLSFSKENSSFGIQKKLKGTQGRNERVSFVSKREMEIFKINEDNAKAVNMYKDLFGEMKLDNELDTEKKCLIDWGKGDVAADKSKLAPNSTKEKNFNVEKYVRQSMLEANTKSVSLSSEVNKKERTKENHVHVTQGDQAKLDKSTKKKLEAAADNRSLNGLSHSLLAKEVEPMLLNQTNVSDKHVHTDVENDRLFEQRSGEGENLLSENSCKRAHDQNGSSVSKKIRMDGLHSREEVVGRDRDEPCQVNTVHHKKYGKTSFLKAKEENGSCKSEIDKGKFKIYESSNESMDCTESYEQIQNVQSSKIETKLVAKKESNDEGAKERTRSESRTKSGEDNVSGSNFDQKQNFLNIDERSLGKHSLPPSGRGRIESGTRSRHLNRGDYKENSVNNLSTSASEGDNALESLKQKESPNSNGVSLRQFIGKRDSSSHAALNALREAKDLKHVADRLKGAGSSAEITGYYFQAALKFLHGASLLESSIGDSAKQSEANQSMQIYSVYSTTGELCKFCAHEYEKSKDMATAALAYKCMEVAYMRGIYSSRGRATRDRLELQAASQIGPPGEYPLSSASNVDSINNPKSDKINVPVNSPQVAAISNHVISSGDRSSFVCLLSYAQDVNFAMEASRKCKIAFAAANQRLEETKYKEEGITSIKRALDFNFQDVEGLLRFFSFLLSKLPCIYFGALLFLTGSSAFCFRSYSAYISTRCFFSQVEEEKLHQNQLECPRVVQSICRYFFPLA